MHHLVQISGSFLECKICNTTALDECAAAAAALKSVMNSLPPSSESHHHSSLKWPDIIGFSGVQSCAPASSYQSPLIRGRRNTLKCWKSGSYEQSTFRSVLLDARMQHTTGFWLSFQELRCGPLERTLSPPLIAAKHISLLLKYFAYFMAWYFWDSFTFFF